MSKSRVIVALDYPDAETARRHVDRLEPELCRLKVGKELFTSSGPALIDLFVSRGFDVFLDLKFHDIPTTVARACTAAARLGVWMLNVHAAGGRQMLLAAREALEREPQRPLLLGVTVLTSLSAGDLEETGISATVEEHVLRLARLSRDAGLDGVVCSAREASALKAGLGPEFLLVTPGIRPSGTAADDQKRTVTPVEAIRAGSNFLVIGRPVTQARDPVEVLRRINDEISSALKSEE